jgi:hypothetical protein
MTSVLFAFYAISSSYGDIFEHPAMNYVTISECNTVLIDAWKIIEFKMQFLDVQVRLLHNYLNNEKQNKVTLPWGNDRTACDDAAHADGCAAAAAAAAAAVRPLQQARLYDPPLRNIFSRHPHGQTNQKNQ